MMPRRSFTFIEIVIVIFIIALLLGMAFMRMDSVIPEARLKKQSRLTADIIELAFSQAAIEGQELSLVLDAREKKMTLDYFIEKEEDEEFINDEVRPAADDSEKERKPLKTVTWDDAIELETFDVLTQDKDNQRDFMVFYPQGTCDGAHVVWKEKSGMTQEVSVWPLLGKVDIQAVNFDHVVVR